MINPVVATLMTWGKWSYSEIMQMSLIDVVAYYSVIFINNENEYISLQENLAKK